MGPSLELVTFVARAENRVEVLLSLSTAPVTRPELQEATDIPRATLSRILADFDDRELLYRDGYEYVLTPLGELLAAEIGSLLDSVEAMQRLEDVRRWLSIDEFDFPVERLVDADVVVPSTPDPTATIRRMEELLGEARRVRLVANSIVPGCLEALWREVTAGRQTLAWVTTPAALEVVTDDPELTQWTRELLETEDASVYVHEDGFPQVLCVVDETVLTPVSDETGSVQGHVETEDEVFRSWSEEAIAAYVREAEPLVGRALAV
jgi:predicted transcriptional regulator